jgi:lycopene cyclase domain-containing protein
MGHFEYLALLFGCVLVTVPLEFVYGFKVWRDPRRLLRAVFPGLVLFLLWDVWAIARGHWSYDPAALTGVTFPGSLPLEELLFFLVIPAAGISGYEAVVAGLKRMGRG